MEVKKGHVSFQRNHASLNNSFHLEILASSIVIFLYFFHMNIKTHLFIKCVHSLLQNCERYHLNLVT